MWGNGRKHFGCVDLHCGGEPARILLSGCPAIPGKSMSEKRLELMSPKFDYIRQTLLQEPRGYPCQNLNFIFNSQHSDADFGYVIAEQSCIYPLFSGHNTICVATALLVRLF
jgi:proline racemase